MTSQTEDQREDQVFAYNAKEGVRSVTLIWFTRRIALPLGVFLVALPVLAFVKNGVIAGLLSAVLVAGPIYLIWIATSGQWRKKRDYLKGYLNK